MSSTRPELALAIQLSKSDIASLTDRSTSEIKVNFEKESRSSSSTSAPPTEKYCKMHGKQKMWPHEVSSFDIFVEEEPWAVGVRYADHINITSLEDPPES
ncbi:sterol O-acyltransferase 2 [Striga asiatica]|uniref:Sterol O-acyltransferase 2 n=1 Tax=Striga asiatica TaxID=4170 RepID=A0A5A7QQK4_STRAF|nr:sterol O-acyltransferase 2 [Striga asiatica]